MYNGIQSFYLSLGNEACFFLQLLNIAEKFNGLPIDPSTAALVCAKKGFIYLNYKDLSDKKNYEVREHAQILELFTGVKWSYSKETPYYRAKKNEYIIDEYKNGAYIHFDSDTFHSLQDSNTVKNGKVISRRVFRVVK